MDWWKPQKSASMVGQRLQDAENLKILVQEPKLKELIGNIHMDKSQGW